MRAALHAWERRRPGDGDERDVAGVAGDVVGPVGEELRVAVERGREGVGDGVRRRAEVDARAAGVAERDGARGVVREAGGRVERRLDGLVVGAAAEAADAREARGDPGPAERVADRGEGGREVAVAERVEVVLVVDVARADARVRGGSQKLPPGLGQKGLEGRRLADDQCRAPDAVGRRRVGDLCPRNR